ncbi:TonB-dependent receptor [Acinetobacter sp. 194]|uniref:TonB-dependent receptor family protein n=1 Tax=Acinetobacter shaoyimingii TaxID=2715164 RepID=UPI00140CEA90|nr:TonB-dependent receptor [Acinetobacter shaoyimingii]NHB58851.1 TonB-dependent receptor [Acinetobacter shaoyimingii]
MHHTIALHQKQFFLSLFTIGVNASLYATEISSSKTEVIEQLSPIILNAHDRSSHHVAKEQMQNVAGATNFIDHKNLEQGRVATTEDVFRLQAGIYAKSAGNEGVKVSIRGSGINRAPGAHASGLYVLMDDIPFTGPGGTPYELLEPLWLNRAEVFRGANGVEKGAMALGGAINYVTQTGQDAERLKLRYELGSRGYQKYAISSGQKINDLDYYIALSGSTYDGFQKLSSGESKGVAANLGYQISPHLETRFYLRYRETEHQTPGRLTKQQIKDNPKAANDYNLLYDTKRIQPGSTWLANKTTLTLDDGAELEGSVAYHRYPMDLRESPYRTHVEYSDVTASLSFIQPYTLLGLDSTGKVLFRSTTHRPDSGVVESLRVDMNGYPAGTITRKYTYRGSDNVIQFSNDLALKENLWLSTAMSAMYTHRENEVYYPVTDQKISEYEWNFAPRIGLRYEFSPNMQLYANYSHSVEPAHPWSMIWGSNVYFPAGSGPAAGRQREPVHLNTQKAKTFELGTRGEHAFGQWDLSYYYSKVKNELLMVELSPLPDLFIAESNASDTLHQGVEVALNSPLWQHDTLGKISFNQAYTYSDFHYKNDPTFAKNQLAGIPKHYYQAQLRLDHPKGMFASINTEYASKIYVDYANSAYADSYQIWGLSFGYAPESQKWQTWLDFKNIGNRHYAATVTPGFNDNGNDVARSTPGEGFSTYAGVSFNF